MKRIQSNVVLLPKKLCLLFSLLLVFGGTLPLANAAAKQCSTDGNTTCCATIWVGSGGACCSAYACSDGSNGGSCGACNNAELVKPEIQESGTVELAGVEHITVNNNVLDLQWS